MKQYARQDVEELKRKLDATNRKLLFVTVLITFWGVVVLVYLIASITSLVVNIGELAS